MRLPWTSKQVDDKLQEIMARIFQDCARTAADYGAPNNLRLGANIAGFLKVANSVVEQGVV
jgi:glutamate dehydrogenase (NADP+)